MEQWYMWQETLRNLEFCVWVIRSLSAETSKDIRGIVKGICGNVKGYLWDC